MTRINREEATSQVWTDVIEKLLNENVEFTNRVTDGTADAGYTELSATVSLPETEEYEDRKITIYVLVDTDEVDGVEELDQIDWTEPFAGATFEILEY